MIGMLKNGACVAAGVSAEIVGVSTQIAGSTLVAAGTILIKGGNMANKGAEACYRAGGLDRQPVQVITSAEEINIELERAQEKFKVYYDDLMEKGRKAREEFYAKMANANPAETVEDVYEQAFEDMPPPEPENCI